ncbi:hypothetical protein PUN28_013952 [Cardiocondyla obscurior]|uniref:Uncharacterized protein n=1 Tax=Cardiocondyla obscurior TaxID=286306 RepID=A0AAW2F5E1_9HYME
MPIIFSVLHSLEAEILKNKKILKTGKKSSCGDVSRCPRNNFQRSIFTRSRDIDKNKKIFQNLTTDIDKKQKKFLKIWQQIFVRDVSRCPRDHFQRLYLQRRRY